MDATPAQPSFLRSRIALVVVTVALFIAIDNARRFPGVALLPSSVRVVVWKLAQVLWWELFAVDETALGGGLANGARLATIGIAIVLTLRHAKRQAHRGEGDFARGGAG